MSDIFEFIISEQQRHRSKRDGIVAGILAAIDANAIGKGDPLPSVNKLIKKLGVARMTVVKALNILKERGMIVAEDKVGYYVKDVNGKRELKVFLFLTGFYSYHETLYNRLIEGVNDPDITIDLYFHHCNPGIFKSVLLENLGSYGLYVITGFDDPRVKALMSRVPPKKLLQIIRPPLLDGVSAITQDFYSGLKKSLEKLKAHLAKYEKFTLIFPSGKGHPQEITLAFTEFCTENKITHRVEPRLTRNLVSKACAFWVIEDSDLIALIKTGEELGLRLGNELGILSYNETPMKEIIRNGITVVSADFAKMGESISRFINKPEKTTELFHPDVIIRNSL
ncbi:GntR family transcriptional regulator [Gaoshiqia sp. Z1-71]|uniref:GntR family transcriptional regulator n=1 Tax=Gaoshiqia hydrogeniformans TaxID=3290090 RepID=UPI003BF8B080